MPSPTVIDARGTRRPLVQYEREAAKITTEKYNRLQGANTHDIKPTRAEIRRAILLFILIGSPYLVINALTPWLVSSVLNAPAWTIALITLPLGIMPAAITIVVMRRAFAMRIALGYVCAGFCGSCGYELEGVSPQPDGCTVCPECGAAWKMNNPAAN